MRKISLVCIAVSLLLVVACDQGNEPIYVKPRIGVGGGTVGSGVDPGKTGNACYPAFEDLQLNVVTWNIENLSSTNTDINKASSILANLDADIVAVQEIRSSSTFQAIASLTPGWGSAYIDIDGSLDLGYYYKLDAFTQFGTVTLEFPSLLREAAVVTATHASGLEVTYMNIHLKCCDDGISQREVGSVHMKSILDSDYANQAVIVLGDWNDEIKTGETSPFDNFKADAANYRFVDQAVADGPSSNWSYPSWPSHIDHILITDELFDYLGNVQTVKPESCVSNYSSDVSDHRPVLASFGGE